MPAIERLHNVARNPFRSAARHSNIVKVRQTTSDQKANRREGSSRSVDSVSNKRAPGRELARRCQPVSRRYKQPRSSSSILAFTRNEGKYNDAKIEQTGLGGREVVRVCIVQKAPAFMDREASLIRAETLIAEAAQGGTDLIVFPEVWLSGYPYWTEGWDSPLQQWAGGRIRFRDAAIVAPSEDTERLGAAARKAGAYVVMGCNEMDSRPEVSTVYNALLFFDRDGQLMGRHRKTMPTFTERLFWGQGDASDLRIFDN